MANNAQREHATPHRARGAFITIEGLDGSGLSTQAGLLKDWMEAQGHTVYLTKEPTAGPVGGLIRLALGRRLALSESTADNDAIMALLFAADRMDHLATDIKPKLDAGVHVICDRYYLSTFAYQSRSVDLAWLRSLHARCIRPDLTILLDVPPHICCQRIAEHRWHVEIYEQEAILEGVRQRYHEIAALLRAERHDIRVVPGDGDRTIADVHKLITAQVRVYLDSSPASPLG
jgi:dTMP kinase